MSPSKKQSSSESSHAVNLVDLHDADMNMDGETDPFGEFNQELKDCVDEPRRVPRRESLRESLRAWLRFEFKFVFESHPKGRFEHGFKCVYTRNHNVASEF